MALYYPSLTNHGLGLTSHTAPPRPLDLAHGPLEPHSAPWAMARENTQGPQPTQLGSSIRSFFLSFFFSKKQKQKSNCGKGSKHLTPHFNPNVSWTHLVGMPGELAGRERERGSTIHLRWQSVAGLVVVPVRVSTLMGREAVLKSTDKVINCR